MSDSPERMQALVASAREGDRGAFEELVRLTSAETYTLAFRLMGDEDDARDVVQEAYLRAYRGISKFRGDAKFTTWMYRITANCAVTQLERRKRHRHEELPDDAPLADASAERDPQARVDVGALRDELTQALQELPPRLRAVVVLRDIYDLPHEAIATELDITETAAKVRLHRARARLRARLFPLPKEEVAARAV